MIRLVHKVLVVVIREEGDGDSEEKRLLSDG